VVDRDIVLAKIATIDRCIRRIEDVRGSRPELRPIDVDDLVIVNLQRATQATIDLAAHVTSAEGYGLADTIAGEFTLLEKNAVIDAELAERMRKMVGFRNIAVHDYQTIDPTIVEAIVTRHLGDLRRFAARIASRFSIA
jgi:uncharacterized protein YutE (UPF0331/DUF86 family)